MQYKQISTGELVEVEHLKEFPAYRNGMDITEITPYFITHSDGSNYCKSAATFSAEYKAIKEEKKEINKQTT